MDAIARSQLEGRLRKLEEDGRGGCPLAQQFRELLDSSEAASLEGGFLFDATV